ncbi:hypothetical protein, partial [Streptomyces sp. NPDC006012]|uniref:hypothetical protein n=1 Tax=Streptomyces sp. NPDC006012 TaxID=3364739 RepID=UPI0036C27714
MPGETTPVIISGTSRIPSSRLSAHPCQPVRDIRRVIRTPPAGTDIEDVSCGEFRELLVAGEGGCEAEEGEEVGAFS